MTCSRLVILAAVCALSCPALALAQEDDPDRDLQPSQHDFTVVNLPTTLRVPKYKSAFRVTHRFARPLGQGDFSDLVEDLFGLDSGAQIGLEYRFGIMRGTQIGIYRTSNRTIEFFAQYSGLQQKDNGCSAWTSSRRWTAQTTSATVIHRRWVSCCRASWAATARSTSSRSG